MQNSKTMQKIGFISGAFDLCHTGHLLAFEECKNYCDYFIVALYIDPTTTQTEKNKPIETIFERFIRLRSCKFVDEIFICETPEDLNSLVGWLHGKYKENLIRFMDEKYKGRGDLVELNLPIKVHFISRKHNYSSTNLKKLCKKFGNVE